MRVRDVFERFLQKIEYLNLEIHPFSIIILNFQVSVFVAIV